MPDTPIAHAAKVSRQRKPDDHVHVNRLRPPHLGIRDLRLKCAGKESKLHLPQDAPDPNKTAGTDSFHFLPEHDTCDLVYELDNPFHLDIKAWIEILARFNDKPLWTLDLVKLGPTWLRHGVHTVKWDGRIIKGDAVVAGAVDGDGTKHDLTTAATAPLPDATAGAPFPDGWITLEHTPYRLRLVVESDLLPDRPAVAWTYFHVLIRKLEISLGEEKMVPKVGAGPAADERWARDKAVRAAIATAGGAPATGSTRDVVLIHNVFTMDPRDRKPNNPTGWPAPSPATTPEGNDPLFQASAALWGDGPRIPLVCKIWMAEAADSPGGIDISDPAAKGAVALGRVRFLWEWSDPAESLAAHSLKPLAFITAALDFDKTKTGPKGDNCHVERGGKRGPKAKPVFPEMAGYAPKATLDDGVFPFPVAKQRAEGAAAPPANQPPPEETVKRLWATYSRAWTSGALKGRTGVIFSPSRIAGDDYIVHVTLANDLDARNHLIVDNDTDEPLKVQPRITTKTGKWLVKRRLDMARYIRKQGTINDFLATSFAGVQGGFAPAYFVVENVAAAEKYLMGEHRDAGGTLVDYQTQANNMLTAAGNANLTNNTAIPAGANHAATASLFDSRDFPDFVQAKHVQLHSAVAAAANDFATYATANPPLTAAGLAAALPTTALAGAGPEVARLQATQNWLNTNNCDTPGHYCETVDGWLRPVGTAFFHQLFFISGGKTTRPAAGGVTIFECELRHSAGRRLIASGGAFLRTVGVAVTVNDRRRDACAFVFFEPDVDTFVHEVGHHLGFAHHGFGNPVPDANPAYHDADDQQCMMSYSSAPVVFCGLCQLRMRGWACRVLSNNDATNTRT